MNLEDIIDDLKVSIYNRNIKIDHVPNKKIKMTMMVISNLKILGITFEFLKVGIKERYVHIINELRAENYELRLQNRRNCLIEQNKQDINNNIFNNININNFLGNKVESDINNNFHNKNIIFNLNENNYDNRNKNSRRFRKLFLGMKSKGEAISRKRHKNHKERKKRDKSNNFISIQYLTDKKIRENKSRIRKGIFRRKRLIPNESKEDEKEERKQKNEGANAIIISDDEI